MYLFLLILWTLFVIYVPVLFLCRENCKVENISQKALNKCQLPSWVCCVAKTLARLLLQCDMYQQRGIQIIHNKHDRFYTCRSFPRSTEHFITIVHLVSVMIVCFYILTKYISQVLFIGQDVGRAFNLLVYLLSASFCFVF